MARLAFRNLFQSKGRLAISVGGVALALLLILALDAVMAGTQRQLTAYIDHSGADVVVSQRGVRNLHMAADEPTANLDSSHGHEIMRLLRSIAKEQHRSVVIVSHDKRIKEVVDRVLWLEDGQFKDMVTMATDPVCGMTVEPDRAITIEQEDRTISFCCQGCRDEFLTRGSGEESGRAVGPYGDMTHEYTRA